jgi:hypothetical protein
MVVLRVQLCGRWCHHAISDIFAFFGGKEMIQALWIGRGWWWNLSLFPSRLVTFGQLHLSIYKVLC